MLEFRKAALEGRGQAQFIYIDVTTQQRRDTRFYSQPD